MADSKDAPSKATDQTAQVANPAGTQPTDQTAAPSAEQIAQGLSGNPAVGAGGQPIPDFDETVPGGAYRTQSGDWVSAEGTPIKPPKGQG